MKICLPLFYSTLYMKRLFQRLAERFSVKLRPAMQILDYDAILSGENFQIMHVQIRATVCNFPSYPADIALNQIYAKFSFKKSIV